MPSKPDKSKSQDSYMSDCVELLKKEGKNPEEARDICYAVWIQNKKRKKRGTKKR